MQGSKPEKLFSKPDWPATVSSEGPGFESLLPLTAWPEEQPLKELSARFWSTSPWCQRCKPFFSTTDAPGK
jgi:hypothetical protein